MIGIKEVLSAFGFANYGELKSYIVGKYNDDEKAWQKIVEEMENKGLSPCTDESEGGGNFITNIW